VIVAAWHQTQVTVGDDGLTRLEATLDHGLRGRRAPDGHRTQIDLLLPVDDEHIGSLLPGLYGNRRHHDRIRVRAQRDHDIHVLARPQPAIGIGERALNLDRARRLIDGVVDEGDATDRR
jgi:hypothetical protein